MASQSHKHLQKETGRRAQILECLLCAERVRLLRHVQFHSERIQDAEDALADACVQFLRFYDGSAEAEDALRWMLLVAKRCAWGIARRHRRRREGLHCSISTEGDDSEAILVTDQGGCPAELAERAEEAQRVMAAIERLVPDERTALILFGLGCSYEEIARLRGWSYAKVNRRLNEGRARVRRMLEEGGERS
jgi:RNA polymerase sigma factor (sigma-70 family)